MKSRKPIQLIIPEPCQRKWDEMNLQTGGRFCDHCQKTVIDFTKFSDKDLYAFFDNHQNEKVCGRFLSKQLNRNIQLPYQPQSRLYRIAVALGLVLSFSQITDVNARWRPSLVGENRIDEMMREDEKIEDDSLVVRGRVVGVSAMEIENAFVELFLNDKVFSRVLTDSDGRFSFSLSRKEKRDIKIIVTHNDYVTNTEQISLKNIKDFYLIEMRLKILSTNDVDALSMPTGGVELIKFSPVNINVKPINIEEEINRMP